MMISGWGRYPRQDCAVHRARSEDGLRDLLDHGPLIARGNGRSYGDCAQYPATTVDMRPFNRMLAFDPETGQLTAESGVLLKDVIETFLPRGWFPAVTPGTKFVTLGGMVAADVHGKNHHVDGAFGAFVDWIDLLGADGEVRRCSRQENEELFAWTLGGMGLTGVIVRLCFRLRRVESGWIRQRTLPARNLDEAMRLFEDHGESTYSVAWIDCLASGPALGRSAIMLGEHATAAELPSRLRDKSFEAPRRGALKIPFDAPSAMLNRLLVKTFNAAYYRRQAARRGEDLVGWDAYFYPLDSIAEWNRIYGRRGFMQYQCVIPLAGARAGMTELLGAIARAGQGSFLAVLKRFGAKPGGAFSFPLEGYTLALDFPVSQPALDLLDRLDDIVAGHGGRLYLAKDSRMKAAILRACDQRVPEFLALRSKLSAAFRSSQSERLKL